jgi:hypothetical protein
MIEKRRIVEVYVPADGAIGSGYLVTPTVVLTARHVVEAVLDPSGPPAPGAFPQASVPGCRVRTLASPLGTPFSDAVAIWWSADADAALVATVDRVPLAPALDQGVVWADLADGDPVEVTAVGFPDAVVEGDIRESRQIVGRVAPLSGAKARRWVVQTEGSIGEVPAGSRSAWAGMSGAALFAGEFLIGIIVVDADPEHPDRLELWAVPARAFANDPHLLAWVRSDGATDAWSRSPTAPEGSLGLLRRIAEANELVRVLPDDVVAKLLKALAAQQDATNDEQTHRAVARVLAMLRSRNVLYAQLDNEIWEYVFASLRELRDTFSAAYAELLADGPRNVSTLVDVMLAATREYLASHEASYRRHIAEIPGNQSIPHWEREWPGLGQAALDLIALREVLVGAVEPLNAFASSGEQLHLSTESPMRNYEISQW